MIFGYARGLSQNQHLDLQIENLKNAGCEKIYSDISSGRKENQKELNKLLRKLRPDDALFVFSVCRIGRSTTELIQLLDQFKKNNIKFKSLSEKYFDTTSPMGEVLLHIISDLKEMEVNINRERSADGLMVSIQNGIVVGRPKGLSNESKETAKSAATLYLNNVSISAIQKSLKISRSQVYRYLKHEKVTLRKDTK